MGHIPYGFFESEMKDYFSQFGTVTNVRVSRSKQVFFYFHVNCFYKLAVLIYHFLHRLEKVKGMVT